MSYTEQLKIIGLIVIVLVGLLLLLSWRRPTIEKFQASQQTSDLESMTNMDILQVEMLRQEADKAVETCKVLGVELPGLEGGPNSLYKFTLSRSCPPESKMPAIRKLVQDLLRSEAPINLSSSQSEEIEKAKMTIARALAAEAQAFARSSMTQAMKDGVAATITMNSQVRSNPSVMAAEAKAAEKATEAERLAAEAKLQNEKVTTAATDTSKNAVDLAKAQLEADDTLAKAAAAAAEAAKAKLDLVQTVATIDTSNSVAAALELEKKAVEVANLAANAAEIKAEVSQAEVKLAEAKSSGEDIFTVDEQFRRKLRENEIAAAELMRQQAEQRRLEEEAQERRLYAIDIINGLLQGGIIQANDETYNKIMKATSNEEIDEIAKIKRQEVSQRKLQETQNAERFTRRLQELNEARQNRAILTMEEELEILNLESEAEFQRRKAEIKANVDNIIAENQRALQEQIDKINAENAEKERKRLDELMAMTPSDRATSQAEESKEKEQELINKQDEKFENYKDTVLGNLIYAEGLLTQGVADILKTLPTYEEFDNRVRVERMKTENAQQKAKREEEEAKFAEYKRTEILSALQNDLVINDNETLSPLRNATNYDRFTELFQIAFNRKRAKDLEEQALYQGSAQEKALFAQNMEPTRTQIVDEAWRNGDLTQEQYDRLRVTSINTYEKFKAVEDELRASKTAARDRRDAETRRRIEEEQKAKEEEERKKREEEERLTQEIFIQMRNQELPLLVTGMFPITEAQKQELMNITDRSEYNRKKEAYILQAYGGTRNPGEELADFFNRRRDEVIAERAEAEARERQVAQLQSEVDSIISSVQNNLTSNNRFWKAQAELDWVKIQQLKSRELSNEDFLNEYRAYVQKTIADAQAEQQRKAEEEKRLNSLDLNDQASVVVVKDADGLDIKYFRIPGKRMGYTTGTVFEKTVKDCFNEMAKDPSFFGFDRTGHELDYRLGTECGFLKQPYWWNITSTEPNKSMYLRQDKVREVPGVDPQILEAANQATADYAVKKENAELEKKASSPEFIQKMLSESKIVNIEGKNYRAFPNQVFLESTFLEYRPHWANIPAAQPRLLDAHNDLIKHGAKSFVRQADKGLEGEFGRGTQQQNFTRLSTESNPFKLSKTDWRATQQYATYIPVENLPAALRVSGFTDYSNVYKQRAMPFPSTDNSRYMTNQNNYLQRTSRTNQYTFFHPAL